MIRKATETEPYAKNMNMMMAACAAHSLYLINNMKITDSCKNKQAHII
jgi:hypothetical protein